MRKIMMAALAVVAIGVPAGAVAGAPAHHADAGMYGITIKNYIINSSDHTVTLKVKIRGLKMGAMSKKNVAGQGHWNIYVGGKLNNYSVNPTTGKTKPLAKGDYKVYVSLVNNNGTPLSEPTRSKTVSVMVD